MLRKDDLLDIAQDLVQKTGFVDFKDEDVKNYEVDLDSFFRLQDQVDRLDAGLAQVADVIVRRETERSLTERIDSDELIDTTNRDFLGTAVMVEIPAQKFLIPEYRLLEFRQFTKAKGIIVENFSFLEKT